jgi:hypothetical protein
MADSLLQAQEEEEEEEEEEVKQIFHHCLVIFSKFIISVLSGLAKEEVFKYIYVYIT